MQKEVFHILCTYTYITFFIICCKNAKDEEIQQVYLTNLQYVCVCILEDDIIACLTDYAQL